MDHPTTPTLMFVAHRAAESRVHAALRASGFGDLTAAQTTLAQRLDPDGIRVTDLAERAGITKQTAGALVDELERNGYVERTADPADARARLVALSGRGRELCGAETVGARAEDEAEDDRARGERGERGHGPLSHIDCY